jgi:arginyl-tRNA synthetase
MDQLYAALRAALRATIKQRYEIEPPPIALEKPPQLALGDAATPVAFELARLLKRSPREIAQAVVAALPPLAGVKRAEVAGVGYVNFRFERGEVFGGAVRESRSPSAPPPADAEKIIVEHTNINPNKAAHIGHLRNAALGDSFVRLLRFTGHRVEVQNYIDNTGVQVADVVVGFEHLEKKSLTEVKKLAGGSQPRLDQYCWDLYARVGEFYEGDPQRLGLRARALEAIEKGEGETAELAEVVSTTIARQHLETMQRLGVFYDLLPRESEILQLKFWEAAFEQLKARGAIAFATSGKNKGCWVMQTTGEDAGAAVAADLDEAKIIVRSNGTITYVGKDIAYQLWKFGLLERDFGYRKFLTYPSGRVVWTTTAEPGLRDPAAPAFGRAARVYNVIDARQSYLQGIVAAGVKALGYEREAASSIHFSYEIVGLSPRCARELGIELTAEEERRPFVEVSGRKGQGVKADELLDRLTSEALEEVAARHPDLEPCAQKNLAHTIAIAALRFFLLRYTRTTAIAFDFRDALTFEGETGPYLQYSVVRAQNIFRKWLEGEPGNGLDLLAKRVDALETTKFLEPPTGDDFWELVLQAAELRQLAQAAVAIQEPALVAKWAFSLAQRFNLFYHKHHILSEVDQDRKAFLLLVTDLVQRQLTRALELLGIEIPDRM